jgi:gluconolactonase
MKSLLAFVFLALATAAPTGSQSEPQFKNAIGKNPGVIGLGGGIEGTSVDKTGKLYTVNGSGLYALDKENSTVWTNGTGGMNIGGLASSRFTRTLGTLIGDAGGHKVLNVQDPKKPVLFLDASKMLQPNDMTISRNEKWIYFSGMNYGEMKGDVWFYNVESKNLANVPWPGNRANGIELSHDDKYLYVSNANNTMKAETDVASVIRYDINANGMPENPQKVLDYRKLRIDAGYFPKDAATNMYANFSLTADAYAVAVKDRKNPQEKEMDFDPDGMRMDSKGTLFATLNAWKTVVMWDTTKANTSAKFMQLDTVYWPTNLEFGGPEGKTVTVVGKCRGNANTCVDSFEHNTPGRAFNNLQGDGGNTGKDTTDDCS